MKLAISESAKNVSTNLALFHSEEVTDALRKELRAI
jgi:hypothetical protein